MSVTSDGRSSVLASGDPTESRALLNALLERTIVSVSDPDDRIVDVNDRFCQVSGYRRDELIGRSHKLMRSGRHPSSFYTTLWSVIRSGQSWRGEMCNRAKNGRLIWLDTTIAPIVDEAGRIARFISVRVDVTRYKRAAEDLRALSSRQTEIAGLARVGGWNWCAHERRLGWDPLMASILGAAGCDSPDLKALLDCFDGEGRSLLHESFRRCLATGEQFDTELDCDAFDGRRLHLRLLGKPQIDRGRIIGVTGVAQDLTEARAQANAEQRFRTLFEAIVSNVPATVTLRDRRGRMQFANRRFTTTLGRDDVVGKRLDEIVTPEIAEGVLKRDATAFESGAAIIAEELIPKGDELRTLLTSRFLVDDAVLGEKLVCSVGQDITEMKTLQEKLEHARAEAESATAAKAAFLATMSHEIRTPMNGVLGMVEALAASDLDAEQRRKVEVLRDSGRMLMRLLNDILDSSKIEAGKIELEEQLFGPGDLAAEVRDAHAAHAAAREVTLGVEVAPEAQGPRRGDSLRLRQILHNLVSNAIKFTERGAVRIRLGADAADRFVLTVEDEGVGMTEEQAARVFDRFSQAERSTARRFGGTGLGLSIVRGLVEAMRGEVSLRSAPGAGSTFTLTLPLPRACATGGAAPRREAPTLRGGLRALVADDTDINRVVMAAFLDGLGVERVLAESGAAAAKAARETAFDILLLDYVMPDMNGVETLERIRADAARAGRPAPPAVAVTGHASPEEIAACREAGFARHLSKPVDPEALAAVIMELTSVVAAAE